MAVPGFSGSSALAQEEQKPEKPKTVKVQAMKKPTFDALTAAQEAIELKDFPLAEIQLRGCSANGPECGPKSGDES